MRRTPAGLLLTFGCAMGSVSCAPAFRHRLTPDLPEYRLAILVRPVAGRCRTTTIPALAAVTSRQTVVWEVMSFDRAACKPSDVNIAAKPGTGPDEGRAFKPAPDERGEAWSVRGLRQGRYKYNVTIGGQTEDPELEIWP
jgi:hypothetical protein